MANKKILARLEITPEQAGMKITNILKDELKISARQRQKVIRTKGVSINGRIVHSQTTVKQGQILEVSLPTKEQVKVEAKPLKLNIIYEDDNILVVNKPSGIVVHHTKAEQKDTSLVQAVAYYYQEHGILITPRPVHRLDKEASGLVVFAKSATQQQKLTEIWPQLTKIYWVRVQGMLDKSGEITTPIKGKQAKTIYTPLQVASDLTTLKVQILTGRTHQIRIHLSSLGHPVLGDQMYGATKKCGNRLALHCWQISYVDPETKQEYCFTAPVPNEIKS